MSLALCFLNSPEYASLLQISVTDQSTHHSLIVHLSTGLKLIVCLKSELLHPNCLGLFHIAALVMSMKKSTHVDQIEENASSKSTIMMSGAIHAIDDDHLVHVAILQLYRLPGLCVRADGDAQMRLDGLQRGERCSSTGTRGIEH